MAMTLEGHKELIKNIGKLANSFDNKTLKKILTKSSKVYIAKAKANAPVFKYDTKRYNTPKVSGRLKAPKGMGKVVATYKRGNLKRSIRKIALRRLVDAILIGPKVKKGRKRSPVEEFGGNKVDGYYAHMVEGGTKHSAANPFLANAWKETGSTVLRNIESELKKQIDKQVK